MKAIIAIVIIIVVGGLGYWIYNSNYKKGGTSTNSPAKTQPNTVSIENMSFQPSTQTVKVGAEVTWTNNDTTTHKVASDTAAFGSSDLAPGDTYKHVFDKAGNYPYHCAIHPSMTATIVVQ